MGVILMALVSAAGINAQGTEPVACGDNLARTFASATDVHVYEIDIETGTNLILHADPLPISGDAFLTFTVTNEAGSFFDTIDFAPEDRSATLETGTLLTSGTFQIGVTAGEAITYQLLISCVTADGEVISSNNLIRSITCGGQVDNNLIRLDELHRYYIRLNEGDAMDVLLESLDGAFSDLRLDFGIYSPNNAEIDPVSSDFMDIERRNETGPLPGTGIYRIYVRGYNHNEGTYRLSLSCTLANGATINANRDNRVIVESTVLDTTDAVVRESAAGVVVDDRQLSDSDESMLPEVMQQAIVLPIESGIAETTLITPDLEGMFAYEFTAIQSDRVEVRVERLSGLNLGVIMLSPDGDTVFLAGLVMGTQLSTQLTIPADGAYMVGLYPLDVEPANSDEAARVTTVVTVNP